MTLGRASRRGVFTAPALLAALLVAGSQRAVAGQEAVALLAGAREGSIEPLPDPLAPPTEAPVPLPEHVRGGYTFIPLPAFAYARNEGTWVGALVAILRGNSRDEIEDIIAPQYLHNDLVGETLAVNYYGFRTAGVQIRAIASMAARIERDFELSYTTSQLAGGRVTLGGEVNWSKDAFQRFYGLGNDAPARDETNYTSRELVASVSTGFNVSAAAAVVWTERFREMRLQPGAIRSLPDTVDQFPDVPGASSASVLGHRLGFLYDGRNALLTPTKGTYVSASAERNQDFRDGAPSPWWRTTLDARQLIPHAGDRLVLVARLLADAVFGKPAPFYERPSLGGESALRAFGRSRFIDDHALEISLEERIRTWNLRLFSYTIGLEVAPFVDIGRVFDRLTLEDLGHPRYSVGPGFRVVAAPNVVARADIAYGVEGWNAFVGIQYPF